MARWAPAVCALLSLVFAVASAVLVTDGTGTEICGRKFCTADCECRAVDQNGKWFVDTCVQKSLTERSARQKLCGQSGFPVIQFQMKGRGSRRKTVAVPVRQRNGRCPLERFVPVKKFCCSDTDKPGQCPYYVDSEELCGSKCQADNDCPQNLKCCTSSCGTKSVCVPPMPPIDCQHKFCVPNYECKDTIRGARCCEIKPGQCPDSSLFCQNSSRHEDCLHCRSDEHCPSNKKCCRCNDCTMCQRPVKPPSSVPEACLHVLCPEGKTCRVEKRKCVTSPCAPVTTCTPPDVNPGQCPSVDDQDMTACKMDECTSDSECRTAQMKCCPSNCGNSDKRCVKSVSLSSCRDVTCPVERTCVEVYSEEHEAVSPMCLEHGPAPGEGCSAGKTPLLLMVSERDLHVLHCGDAGVFNPLSCPQGYNCTQGNKGSYPYPVCCPEEPSCHPPCPESQRCEEVSINDCTNPPCVFTKCVTKNICSLPKIVNDGKCLNQLDQILRYYYDNKQHKCRDFGYNCGGNANNFQSMNDCQKQCENQKQFKDVCPLPRKPGDCWFSVNYNEVYYFDLNFLLCRTMPDFHCGFSATDTNANNFKLKEDCDDLCMNRYQCPDQSKSAPCRGEAVDKCSYDLDDNDPDLDLTACRPGKACCSTPCGYRCLTPELKE